MKSKLVVMLLLAIYWVGTMEAQTPSFRNTFQEFLAKPPGKHELALSLLLQNSFNLIYKKEIRPNRFFRLRINDGNYTFEQRERTTVFSTGRTISGGFAIGVEKRKKIKNKLWLIHGFEPALSIKYSESRRTNQYTITCNPQLGYVLGIRYEFNNRFYIHLENTPFIATEVIFYNSYNKPEKPRTISGHFNGAMSLLSLGFRLGS